MYPFESLNQSQGVAVKAGTGWGKMMGETRGKRRGKGISVKKRRWAEVSDGDMDGPQYIRIQQGAVDLAAVQEFFQSIQG